MSKIQSPSHLLRNAILVNVLHIHSSIMLCFIMKKPNMNSTSSPFYRSDKFLDSESYRNQHLPYSPDDHPIVAQFCGNDKELLSQASRLAEKYCDAVDLNLGCPQQRALDGHYGSYLLDRKVF